MRIWPRKAGRGVVRVEESCIVRDIHESHEGRRKRCKKTIRGGGVFAVRKRAAGSERLRHRFGFRRGLLFLPPIQPDRFPSRSLSENQRDARPAFFAGRSVWNFSN